MKKNLLLFITILLEALFVICFAVPQFKEVALSTFPWLESIWESFKFALGKFADLIHISEFLTEFPMRLTYTISLVIVNVIYIVVYEIIATIIAWLIRRSHKKTLVAHKLDTYELTEEEKARFSWKLYQRRFSWIGLFSFVIPTLIILFFIFLRFDQEVCVNDEYNNGFSLLYSNGIKPFINTLIPVLNTYILDFIDKYISLMESIYEVINSRWIEYIIIVFAIIVIYFIWLIFVWVFKRIFKKSSAKRRARKSRDKYIAKMEKRELKARKAAGERISSREKNTPVGQSISDYYEDVGVISSRANIDVVTYSDVKNADYMDNISAGVIDLGVAATGEEEDKEPIEKKMPIFVGEEDVDIILENEPIIETIEEEDSDDYFNEEELFFEKYVPETLDLSSLDESLLIKQVEVVDEDGSIKNDEKEVISIKQFKEKENVLNKEIVIKPVVEKEVEQKKKELKPITPIDIPDDESFIDEPVVKEVKPLDFKPKKERKKPIKPISVSAKFNSEERFKDAKKKYLKLNVTENNKQEEIKKRQLLRRKKAMK